MFERMEIWEEKGDHTWIYVIFRDLATGLFHVQQASAIYASNLETTRSGIDNMATSIVELFQERTPSKRSKGFSTIADAFMHHKAEFAEMIGDYSDYPKS
jgi:hypothetical protein